MVAQVMRDRSHRQDRMRRRVYATMALAASVLLLLFLAYYWMPRPETQDPGAKDKVAKEEPKKLPPREEKLEPTPKKDAPPNILPDRLTGTMRDHARVVLAAANLENVDRLPVGVPPAAPGAREAGEVSVGVEAVTRSTRKAFDFFARELPMPDMGEQKN
jgi:hypothetical protein